MNQTAETYFTTGCGRCANGGTPACKANTWAAGVFAAFCGNQASQNMGSAD